MYQKKSHGWYKHKDFILLDLQHSRRSSRWFGVLCDDEGKKASVKLAEIVIYWER